MIGPKTGEAYTYWNKLSLLEKKGNIDSSISICRKLEDLAPDDPWIKLIHGTLLEVNGDSLSAQPKYIEAEVLYKPIIDTIQPDHHAYEIWMVNYAACLKLLGKLDMANNLLNELQKRDIDPAILKYVDQYGVQDREGIIEGI